MINPKKIEQIARQIKKSLPQGILNLKKDAEIKINQILQNYLNTTNIVGREEFNVHIQMLLRVREKLNQLESRIDKLETTMHGSIKPENQSSIIFDDEKHVK